MDFYEPEIRKNKETMVKTEMQNEKKNGKEKYKRMEWVNRGYTVDGMEGTEEGWYDCEYEDCSHVSNGNVPWEITKIIS